MRQNLEVLRRDVESLPDGDDKKAMLDALAFEEKLNLSYQEALIEHEALQEKKRLSQRRENIARFVIGLPASIVPGYFAVSGLIDGKVKNFFVGGRIDLFSDEVIPYVPFDEEPYLFCVLIMLYGLFAFAFGAASAGITYFGKKPAVSRSRSDFNLRFNQAKDEFEQEQVARGKVGSIFGYPNYSPRVPTSIVVASISTLLAVILWQVFLLS